jgi:hypothetical protein
MLLSIRFVNVYRFPIPPTIFEVFDIYGIPLAVVDIISRKNTIIKPIIILALIQ